MDSRARNAPALPGVGSAAPRGCREPGICPRHLGVSAQNSLRPDCVFAHTFFTDQRFYTRKKAVLRYPVAKT